MANLNGIKILIADDEMSIVQFLQLGLTNEGATVEIAIDGQEAIRISEQFKPQVVILDVMMPEVNGFDACQHFKKQGNDIAVIMLTAKDDIEDRILGLSLGADDYLVKPFSFGELLARIHARIRNQFPSLLSEVSYGPFTIDERKREIKLNNCELVLSPTEYGLLKFLIMHHGTVLSKSTILDRIWGYDFGGEQNIVEVYIRSLREKIGDRDHRVIRTLRGAGYRMDLL